MPAKPDAPATGRNKHAILEVLREELEGCRSVLEIGSGTGQHAVFFAAEMPWLTWQTSDLEENHDGINAWLDDAGPENVLRPLILDVENARSFDQSVDAVFSANTAHIMSIDAVESMFGLVGRCLQENGKFCLYGPFNLNGEFTSDSNRDFDASLKMHNSHMGIRDLATLDEFAEANRLSRSNLYAMPANNMIAVWNKV